MAGLISLVRAINILLQQRFLDIQRQREEALALIFELADRVRLSDHLGQGRIERRHDSGEDAVCPVAAGIRKKKTPAKIPECDLTVTLLRSLGRIVMGVRKGILLGVLGLTISECRQKRLFRRLYEIIGSPQSFHQDLKISRRVGQISGCLCFGNFSLLGSVRGGCRQRRNGWSDFGSLIGLTCRRSEFG